MGELKDGGSLKCNENLIAIAFKKSTKSIKTNIFSGLFSFNLSNKKFWMCAPAASAREKAATRSLQKREGRPRKPTGFRGFRGRPSARARARAKCWGEALFFNTEKPNHFKFCSNNNKQTKNTKYLLWKWMQKSGKNWVSFAVLPFSRPPSLSAVPYGGGVTWCSIPQANESQTPKKDVSVWFWTRYVIDLVGFKKNWAS